MEIDMVSSEFVLYKKWGLSIVNRAIKWHPKALILPNYFGLFERTMSLN